MTAKLLQFPVRIHAQPEPRAISTEAELASLLDALIADARWCEQFSDRLSYSNCGRLRKLARRLRNDIKALSQPGRS